MAVVSYIIACFGNILKYFLIWLKKLEVAEVKAEKILRIIRDEKVEETSVERKKKESVFKSSLNSFLNAGTEDELEEKEEELGEVEHISLGKFTTIAAKNAMKVSGFAELLAMVQEILVMVNEKIALIKSICEWKDEQVKIASYAVIGLYVGCIGTFILKDTYFLRNGL
eukprot:209524_1